MRLAADIGCGTGRYDHRLLRRLGRRTKLFCIDFNDGMLRHLVRHMGRHEMGRYLPVRAGAEALPLPSECLDCLFTFNAVHHFDRSRFFREMERVLRPGGLGFIYTRFRSQNRRNVWGMFFPDFAEKETRLFEREQLVACIEARRELRVEAIHHFVYHRKSDLVTLLVRAENHCYSTFALYGHEEFQQALLEFQKRLLQAFPDPGDIRWTDENAMVVVKKTAG